YSRMSVPPPAATVETVALARRFGARRAVDGVSLSLGAGDCLALFGPNGAGKTTLLRLLAGLLKPDAGVVRLEGEPLARDARSRASGAGRAGDRAPAARRSSRRAVHGTRRGGRRGAHRHAAVAARRRGDAGAGHAQRGRGAGARVARRDHAGRAIRAIRTGA